MNPKNLCLMAKPGTGRVYLVERKVGRPALPLKDVTADYLMVLVSEIIVNDGVGLEQVFSISDGSGRVLEVELVARIVGDNAGENS